MGVLDLELVLEDLDFKDLDREHFDQDDFDLEDFDCKSLPRVDLDQEGITIFGPGLEGIKAGGL